MESTGFSAHSRSRVVRYFAPALLLAAMLMACARAPIPPPPPSDAASVAIERLKSPGAETWLEDHGKVLARELSPSEAERVASVALDHPSPQVRIFAIALLFERVDEQKGAEAAALRLIKGDDLLGMLWGWMHAAPADIADRRLDLIRKEVQERLPSLADDERKRAEKLLCSQPSGC